MLSSTTVSLTLSTGLSTFFCSGRGGRGRGRGLLLLLLGRGRRYGVIPTGSHSTFRYIEYIPFGDYFIFASTVVSTLVNGGIFDALNGIIDNGAGDKSCPATLREPRALLPESRQQAGDRSYLADLRGPRCNRALLR